MNDNGCNITAMICNAYIDAVFYNEHKHKLEAMYTRSASLTLMLKLSLHILQSATSSQTRGNLRLC